MISVIAGSAVLSYGIRAQPLDYAMELDEFDPYYNYRATKFLIDHGWEQYTQWVDHLSWFPTGRDVSATSQVMLHVTAAVLYETFVSEFMSLYEFTIYFPAVIGSLTVIPIFLLVRLLTNTQIGLLAAFFFASSVSFIQRGTAGWFKSEPLGLFYGIFAIYFVVSGVKELQNGKKNGVLRLILAGMLMTFAISSWGGSVFFLVPLAIWILTLPKVFESIKTNYIVSGLLVFTGVSFVLSFVFDRANSLMSGLVTGALLVSIGYLAYHHFLNKRRKWSYCKTVGTYLAIFSILGVIAIGGGFLSLPNDRYINVLLPINVLDSSLTRSVSEHQIPSFGHIFERTVFLMIFAPIGIFAIIRRQLPADVASFAVIFSVLGLYIGTTIVRLELFMSFAMIILASIGIYYLFKRFNQANQARRGPEKFLGYAIITILLIVTVVPAVTNWSAMMDRPPVIATGGAFTGQTDAWLETLEWLKNNTPEDSQIMAWWDYGYWIETKSNRTTYMDNAAFHADRIENYASILTGLPSESIQELRDLEADYVLVFITGMVHPEVEGVVNLGAGGDISKMGWILEIGGNKRSDFIDSNGLKYNFYEDTLFGKMIPFIPVMRPGDPSIHPWETDGDTNTGWSRYDPSKIDELRRMGLELVYVSSELRDMPDDGRFASVLVYKVI